MTGYTCTCNNGGDSICTKALSVWAQFASSFIWRWWQYQFLLPLVQNKLVSQPQSSWFFCHELISWFIFFYFIFLCAEAFFQIFFHTATSCVMAMFRIKLISIQIKIQTKISFNSSILNTLKSEKGAGLPLFLEMIFFYSMAYSQLMLHHI